MSVSGSSPRYLEDGELSDGSREKIAQFIARFLPAKGQKDEIKDVLRSARKLSSCWTITALPSI